MSTAQRIITDHWKNCHAWDRLLWTVTCQLVQCTTVPLYQWYSGTVDIWTTEIKNKLSRDKVYSAQKREASKALFSHCCAAHCSVRPHWSNPLQCILSRMQCVVVDCGIITARHWGECSPEKSQRWRLPCSVCSPSNVRRRQIYFWNFDKYFLKSRQILFET